MADTFEQSALPLDVVQIVLGYVQDARSLAAARQACRFWLQAATSAPCTVRVALPCSIQEMRGRLELLHQLFPSLSGCLASVAASPEHPFTHHCLQSLSSFPSLKQLEISFSESVELEALDLVQLASLTGLTSLRLHNAALPAGVESSVLTQLQGLQELSLVHVSKVSALMTGDSHLQVLDRLSGLTGLILQGRMCSATDDGLLALTGLNNLASLAISWVPWQSQISQRAALQLLANLKQLRSLQLGGAELLLPSAPYHPTAAPAGASTPAGLDNTNNMLNINVLGQHHGGLIAAAVAAVSRADVVRGSAAAASQSALQGEYMRKVLGARAEQLDTFKLQFNCCGTGVEKALLSIGEVRRRLTGLQWSYAKLTGPTSISLLATCTNLRSLKLRLWYQDYNLAPFEFKLVELAPLVNLRTLVIDKRPPFQQQLPAQQAAVNLPLTTPVLNRLSQAWPHLEKLQLGLARSDFGSKPLEGLAGFSNLKSLSVHCYDQGYDDGHFMLPIDVRSLPTTLIKLDLMHAELFSNSSSSSPFAKADHNVAGSSGSTMASCLRSCSSHVASSSNSRIYIDKRKKLSSSRAGNDSSSGGSGGKTGFAAASALTSMLSESFSLLSRQASAECSAAYLQRHLAPHKSPDPAPAGPAGPNRSSSLPSTASGHLAGKGQESNNCGSTLNRSVSTEPASSWLKHLLHESHSRADSSAAGKNQAKTISSYEKHGLIRQPSLPPLPKQQSITPRTVAKALASCKTVIPTTVSTPAAAAAADRDAVPNTTKWDQQAVVGLTAETDAAASWITASPVPNQKPARLQNPFAAAAAAAAVHAEMGGCVTAVHPSIAAAAAAAVYAEQPQLMALGPMMTEPVVTAANINQHAQVKQGGSSRRSNGSLLTTSFSMNFGRHFGQHAKVAPAPMERSDVEECSAAQQVPCLPSLQHLQLKHCALDGLCLDDIISDPRELRSFQLIEVCGLTPRDVTMMPMLVSLQRLTLIAAKEDAWLGLAPLRLLSKLPDLRHLDWVVSERALPTRSKATELQQLAQFPRLQIITLHTALGRCEQLHAVSGQLPSGCHVRLMAPAYCEHAVRRSGSKLGRLLGAASCLIPGTAHGHCA